jgi:putative methionine-R-sulfoxide reductase with GAF domain
VRIVDPLLAELDAVFDQPALSRAARAALVAERIQEASGARWVGIYSVDQTHVTNEAWVGPGPPAHPTFQITEGLTSHAVATRSPALSNDVARDPRYLSNQDDSGSELIIPILLGERVVGTLDVESDRIGAFDGATVAQLERIAAALVRLWSDEEV